MLGTLDREEIVRVLRSQHIGRLGVRSDDDVYIFPVAYGYDGESIYIHSSEGLKLDLMRAHPRVCFQVEEIDSPSQWRSVLAHGTFEELTAQEERDAGMEVIALQSPQPYAPSVAPYLGGPESIVVYRIRVTDATGRYERHEVFPRRVAC